MILRIFFLLVGFGLAVSGGITMIAYLNLITVGHGVISYLQFISARPETYLFIGGIALIWVSIYYPFFKKDDHEL